MNLSIEYEQEQDGQADVDQRQAGNRVKDLDRQESNEIHVHPSQTGFGGRPASDLDHVLLVVSGVLDKIAHRGGIRRLLLREVFQHLELLVADLGDVNIEHAMVGWRVDRDLA